MAIGVSEAEGCRTITIDRPPVNALDLDAIVALEAAFVAAASDRPRGVVLIGAGSAFCAGVDTRAFGGYDSATRHEMVRAITRMVAALLAIPVPVVVAVNGHALGGGFVLMLGGDYRLVADADGAKLGLTEAKAGVPFPAGPTAVIAAELAPSLLRRLTLTSATLSPGEAVAADIADALAAPKGLLAQAADMAMAMAAQPAFGAVKQQVRGPLAARLAALAASGDEPFLAAFG
ncbi:MAG: enoyl-CoA hydratase/isomerase family protein [Sphingomonas sp.]|nr:enoyl-CoA hydratase/isomerase family protein [Sphingomonas sp.]